MKLLVLTLFHICIFAQQTITVLGTNALMPRSARVNVTLSGSARVYAQFGLTSNFGTNSANVSGSSNAVVDIIGLSPASTNIVRICQTGFTPPTGCTSSFNIETPPDINPTPDLPDPVDTTFPSSFTNTYTVLSDCSNLQSQINTAAAQDGNNNYLISIPAGTVCAGKFTNPTKTGTNPNGTGNIVIASDGVLPPAGSMVTPVWENQLVTFLQNTVNSGFPNWTGPNPAACTPRLFQWRSDLGVWYLCNTLNTWSLVSSTPNYTSGSTVPPSTTCDNVVEAGNFYERSGVGNNGLYYCYKGLRWINVAIFNSGSSPQNPGGASIAFPDTGSNAVVTGYRYAGILFRPMFENYSLDNPSAVFGSGATRVILDRSYFWNPRTSAGGGIGLNGIGVAVINSYIDLVPWADAIPSINITGGDGPFFISNNNIGGCFVPIFANDNGTTLPRNSFTITKNEIYMQPECNPRGPNYDGRGGRDARAAIEMKRGTKVLVEGNYIHDWSPLSQVANGPGILMTPRAGPSTGGDDNQTGMSDITIRYNTFKTGTGGFEIWGNDDQGYRGTRPTTRALIEHNLGYDINGKVNYFTTQLRSPMVFSQDGLSYFTIRNNTWINGIGTSPGIFTFTAPVGALRFINNLVWLNSGDGVAGGDAGGGGIRWANASQSNLCDGSTVASSSNAVTKLNLCGVSGTTTDYKLQNNLIIGGAAGHTSTFQPNYPGNNLWPGDTTTGITNTGFQDYNNSNFAFKANSTYYKYGVGADPDASKVAQGSSWNARALGITTNAATIYWSAPTKTTACVVEYGTSSTPGTGTRVSDTPGGTYNRSRALSGLSGGTTYFYRIYCNKMISGYFSTL